MVCGCKQLFGKRMSACTYYADCTRELINSVPSPDTEALFKKFIDEFPVLSALDVFCNPCGRPRAISYHKTDPRTGYTDVVLGDGFYFYVAFSCNCPQMLSICHHTSSRPPTRERIVEILRGERYF